MDKRKVLTISIPIDAYDRVASLCPGKKRGSHCKRDFYAQVFLNGLDSPEFLKAEKVRLATRLHVAESTLRSMRQLKNTATVASVAGNLEALQDTAPKQSDTTHSVKESSTSGRPISPNARWNEAKGVH